ncbi:MAG: hypothetical protein HKM05_03350 [Spirochaetales bacterium]|nr:hypothetical protein [Spirochaetales bacterium]
MAHHDHVPGTGNGKGMAFRDQIANSVIDAVNPQAHDTIYDIGSGDGHYSARLAEKAARVVAFDARPDVFQGENYQKANITAVPGNICPWVEAHGFHEASQVFFSNSFHDMPCQEKLLELLGSTLRPASRLNFVEFKLATPFGPPADIRYSPERLKQLVEAKGFRLVKELSFEYHYFHTYEKLKE